MSDNITGQQLEPSVITREFNAPPELVFAAWTQVEHLNQWMFPMPGCRCEYVQADITNNGQSLHKITMPNGHEMWLFTEYEVVQAPEKLVFLQYMSNQQGDKLPSPHMPNWPKHMVATLLFEALAPNKTQLTFLWEPRNPSPEEVQAFESSRAGHGKGWGAGLAQLDTYLHTL